MANSGRTVPVVRVGARIPPWNADGNRDARRSLVRGLARATRAGTRFISQAPPAAAGDLRAPSSVLKGGLVQARAEVTIQGRPSFATVSGAVATGRLVRTGIDRVDRVIASSDRERVLVPRSLIARAGRLAKAGPNFRVTVDGEVTGRRPEGMRLSGSTGADLIRDLRPSAAPR